MTSDSVGWAWVARPISQGVASSSKASDASAMRSVACGPMMWTPSVSLVATSLMTLANPSYSPPMIALRDRLERHLADLDLEPALGALRLGQPDRGDLGPAVRRPRLPRVVHLVDVGVAGDRVRGDQALVGRGVGQPQAADHVADGVDVLLLGPHPPVDLDDATIDLDLGRLETDLLDVRGAAGRDEQDLGADLGGLLALGTDGQPDARLVDVLTDATSNRALVMTVIPRFVKLRSSSLLTSASSSGTICGQVLEQRHLDPDVVEQAGELDADGARADDHDVLGQRLELEDVVAGQDPLAVGREPGQRLDP